MSKNIRIRGTAFSNNLERLRLENNLSKSDLAHATGLSWRTIDNYVKDRFEFAQESALLRIAEALHVTLDDLLKSDKASHPIYLRPVFLITIIILASLLSGWALRAYHDQDNIEIREMSVVLPGGVLEFESNIVAWVQNTWDDRDVLVIGKVGNSEKYGSVVAIDVSSAEVLWEHRPDHPSLQRVFSISNVGQGDFYAHTLNLTDLDGDGVKEVAVSMRHKGVYS